MLEQFQGQHKLLDKWVEDLCQRTEEGAQQTRQPQEVADMHQRGFQSHDQRIVNVGSANLALLQENEPMKAHLLTLSKEIDINRAARNRHLQYEFLTHGEHLASSVLATYPQETPMHVDLTRLFTYEKAAGDT